MKKTFTTKAGTVLPLLDLRGNDYLEVKYRIQWMREEHPVWNLFTQVLFHDDKKALVKAEIMSAETGVIATGHSLETAVGFKDYVEKAETAAIGRALAHAGYGTQFAAEMHEGKLADSPIVPVPKASPSLREESDFAPPPLTDREVFDLARSAQYEGDPRSNTTHTYRVPFGKKYKGLTLEEMGVKAVQEFAEYLQNSSAEENKPLSFNAAEFVKKAEEFLKLHADLRR